MDQKRQWMEKLPWLSKYTPEIFKKGQFSLSVQMLQLINTDTGGRGGGVGIEGVLINPFNPKIKIWILIFCPYSFPTEVVGRSW